MTAVLPDAAAAAAVDAPALADTLARLFLGDPEITTLPRTARRMPDGTWIGVSAAVSPSLGLASTKTATEVRTADGLRGHSLLSLIDLATGRIVAAMEAEALTALRVAAASLAMARLAGHATPRRIAIVGTGALATAHLRLLRAACAPAPIAVWGRRRERVAAMIDRCGLQADPAVSIADALESALETADVVVCATAAAEPLVREAWLAPDAFVAGVGAHDEHTAELEPAVFATAARVLTDRAGTCGVARILSDQGREGCGSAGAARGRIIWQSSGSADQDLAAGWHVWTRSVHA